MALIDGKLMWMDLSACIGVDPELFFPQRGASVSKAKAICARCCVQSDCLEYAMTTNTKVGVWGFTSERERRRMRRQARISTT